WPDQTALPWPGQTALAGPDRAALAGQQHQGGTDVVASWDATAAEGHRCRQSDTRVAPMS
ncbi:MAG TPA: hypothetical protein VF979_10090, partial [Streptosporangiaceae bacterium]